MQNKVKEFNENVSKKEPLSVNARLLDIGSELGELQKEYLKASNYGASEFHMTEDFLLEYGDVLYSLFSLANECKLDANIALDKVLTKYTNRIKTMGGMGSKKE